jgi:hypothetical protein
MTKKAWKLAPLTSVISDAEADRLKTQWLDQEADAIRALGSTLVRNILDIGKRLNKVRDALNHGEWQGWLEREFQWSDRTARRYMLAAATFADTPAKSDTVSVFDRIEVSALHRLAKPSTPEAARRIAVERAQLGERITAAKATEIVKNTTVTKPVKVKVTGEPFSWTRDPPATIAAAMLCTDKPKAAELACLLGEMLRLEEETSS